MTRISWAAIGAVVFLCGAFVCAAFDERTFAQVFALGAIVWAILSLKEQT